MKRPKHAGIAAAELMVWSYPANKRLIADAVDNAYNGSAPRPEVQISGKGKTGDPTQRAALSMVDNPAMQKAMLEIAAVDRARTIAESDYSYERIISLLESVYWSDGSTTITRWAVDNNCSYEWAHRLARRFFRWVAAYFNDNQ